MPKHGILTDRPNDWVGDLWVKHADKIYKQCVFRTHSEEAAKDLFQDVALKFCRKVHELNVRESLEGWFSVVVRSTFFDDTRKHQKETPVSMLRDVAAEYRTLPETASVHYTNDRREHCIQEAVEELLQTLTPAEKMVVEGTFIAGMSLSEMARDFGMSRCLLWRKRDDALRKMRESRELREPVQKKTEMPMVILKKLLT